MPVVVMVVLTLLCVAAAFDGHRSRPAAIPAPPSSDTTISSATQLAQAAQVANLVDVAAVANFAAVAGAAVASPTPGAPGPPGQDPPPAEQPCGVLDLAGCISGAISTFLRGVVTDALNPMLALLSDTLLSTPNPSKLPRLVELWNGSWEILLATYGLLVLAAGILLMGYETVQSRYTLRELAPRVVLGFCTGALSLTGASAAIEVTNAVTTAVLAGGVDEAAGADALADLVTSALASSGGQAGLFGLVLGLVVAAVLLALLLTFIVRVALTIVLIAGAPIALMFHALPHTDGIARWWWRTFAALLAIQLGQSLTLVVGLRVLLTPDGFGLLGLPNGNGLITLLVTLALLYLLFKIPFWLLAASRVGQGRSVIGSLVRSFVAYKTFGLITGRSRGTGGSRGGGGSGGGGNNHGGTGGPGGGPGPRPTPGPRGPYTQTRATTGGQLMLPLEGITRRGRGPAHPDPLTRGSVHRGPASPDRARSSPRGRRQLALPLADGDWPEHRPVRGRDGHYQLPLDVTRRSAARQTSSGAPAPSGPVPAPSRGRHHELPPDPFSLDPFQGHRPLRSGQYPLPLEGLTSRPRRPNPPTSPSPPLPRRGVAPLAPAPARGRRTRGGRQLPLPVDLSGQPQATQPTPAAGHRRGVADPPRDPARETARGGVTPARRAVASPGQRRVPPARRAQPDRPHPSVPARDDAGPPSAEDHSPDRHSADHYGTDNRDADHERVDQHGAAQVRADRPGSARTASTAGRRRWPAPSSGDDPS